MKILFKVNLFNLENWNPQIIQLLYSFQIELYTAMSQLRMWHGNWLDYPFDVSYTKCTDIALGLLLFKSTILLITHYWIVMLQ